MNPQKIRQLYLNMRAEADKVLVGLEDPFEILVIALLTGGHVLLEGVPGTAKTLMAKTMARLVAAEFKRIQFTPDLMPSDILGTSVFDMQSGSFNLKKGPIFTQICLADEINRAPAKTQAALLEAMEEKQINLEGERHVLEAPFMVIATQNPIEYEGTYPLPEAQLDRFLFKIIVPHAPEAVEVEVLRRYSKGFSAHNLDQSGIDAVLTIAEFKEMQEEIIGVTVEDGILNYIAKITALSRQSPDLVLGASTRASTHVLLASKTAAAIQGRDFVTPDDVKMVIPHIFRHRVILKPEAEIEGLDADAVVRRILSQVEVPR
ncbi:MAG: MoxR family ATPase [Chloroflexota bacterium]